MLRVAFLQYAPELSVLGQFQRCMWERTPGYGMWKPTIFEPPPWMGLIWSQLNDHVEAKIEIATLDNFEDSEMPHNQDVIFGSVMSCHRAWWQKAVTSRPATRFVLGGYTDPIYADNVHWVHTHRLSDPGVIPTSHLLKTYLVHDYSPVYSWVGARKVVPRLTLSRGCKHSCTFCTIPTGVEPLTMQEIDAQVRSICTIPNFELVYIDDKTFGQATTHSILEVLFRTFAAKQPEFQGFIVQTTPLEARDHLAQWVEDYGVKYVEVGVETVDLHWLRTWKKPFIPSTLDAMVQTFKKVGKAAMIPNIMLGIPPAPGDPATGHNYQPTIDWLQQHRGLIAFPNLYWLSDYKTPYHLLSVKDDADENSTRRSWLTEEQARGSVIAQERIMLMFQEVFQREYTL